MPLVGYLGGRERALIKVIPLGYSAEQIREGKQTSTIAAPPRFMATKISDGQRSRRSVLGSAAPSVFRSLKPKPAD
jgi:hypothetical protein